MAVFITIRKRGNFGNQLIQYMAALALSEILPDARICDFHMPDYGIAEPGEIVGEPRRLSIDRISDFSVPRLLEEARAGPLNVHIDHYSQQISNLLDVGYYRRRIPPVHRDVPIFGDEHLLINVRAGEILTGRYPHYPLVPVDFYRDIAERSGKIPVFMGQTEDSPYLRAIGEAFPDALFLPSEGPARDFDIVRAARHIVASASTFSWAASWLSEAASIHLPLTGAMNPNHIREVDLLPSDDPRYSFYLFPLNFALPVAQALDHHKAIAGSWKAISPERLGELRSAAKLLPESSAAGPDAFEKAYVHRHLDAAMAISEGRYRDAAHHYREVGRARGYAPQPQD